MNSALKPVLGGAGVPPAGGQASPAKGNVAGVNHAAVGLPQGAQNSLHHSNNLVGQNLSQHAPPPQAPPHAVPSMAPVSANMAQMAQNMSHHGNLSHLNQNSAAPPPLAPSPTKAPSTSSPLSLVQDKVNASQPLALTRTEKKEPEASGHSNGSIDSPKSGASAPTTLKPQNPEPNKDKQDIAKTSPSTPKPPEKPANAQIMSNTPQKPEGASAAGQVEGAAQPKVATANELREKSPLKPTEPIPAPTADVAPSQSDSKPVPESANNQSTSQSISQLEKAPTPVKQDPPSENAKIEAPKVEEKKEQTSEKPPSTAEETKEEIKDKVEPKKEDQPEKPQPTQAQPPKVEEKPEEKKEPKKTEPRPKSTLKLATVTPPIRKRRQVSPAKNDGPSPAKKLAEGDSTPESRTKRNRTKVQLYQSPTPELAMATKLSASAGRATPTKPNDDKLIVFYKNEYLAVRNAEGGFYVCQTMQNVYRTTRKIKIRWLSQDKTADPSGETYKPDFYDVTDMECVLTTLSLSRSAGGAQVLRPAERARATSILQRALRAEQAGDREMFTAEHPDGLDLSLYTDESQLDKKTKRNSSKSSPRNKNDSTTDTQKEPTTPAKKTRTTPKRSPKSSRKAKTPATKTQTNNNKRKSSGSTPPVATTSKTATAVTEKAKTPARGSKRTPAKKETPVATPSRGRRAAKESKPSPIVATPSTSTGKTTRTPRKPPSRK